MTKEGALIARMLLAGARSDARMWRNLVGVYWAGQVVGHTEAGHLVLAHATRVTAGLCDGSSDLVGIVSVPVAMLPPDGVVGVFTGLEVKTPGDTLKKHQRRWLQTIRDLGGIAAEVRSPEDVVAALDGGRGLGI